MKVLFITGLHPLTKKLMTAIFITRRLRKLQEHGVDCDIYYFSEKASIHTRFFKWLLKRPSFKEKRTITVEGVRYTPISVNVNIWDMLFYHQRVGRILVDAVKNNVLLDRYDLIHAPWVYPHGYIAALLKQETGIPCIVSAHGSDIHTNPYKNPGSIKSVLFALEYADKVIFNNYKLLKDAKKLGYSGVNSKVILNGVETEVFDFMNKERAREKLDLMPKKAKIIGFVGNLKRVKRADMLPEIFKQIARQYHNIQFIIVGEGKLRRSIEKKCYDYKLNVHFTGQITAKEMPTWMNAFDILVLPSRHEGFPNVCLEAQACGCPVVGSNAGGIPEAIGDGGLIVDDNGKNFVKDFCTAVIKILNDPPSREQLRKRALQFDLDYVTQKQISVYKNVIKDN